MSPHPVGRGPRRRPEGGTGEAVAVYGEFITRDPALKGALDRLSKIARSELSILLIGETGTGKEMVAQYIHQMSPRRLGPFVAVNCGAISKNLFESTFFGYERGAFTGADAKGRRGLCEAASGGTLFLDEIGEMPLAVQAGLLRVLESRAFRRVGSDEESLIDCRVIAATNRSLLESVGRGEFRSDLYYRLSVAQLSIPPLRERPDDVPALAEHLLSIFCARHGIPSRSFAPETLEALVHYPWPGNAREVRNVVEAAVVCGGEPIAVSDLPPEIGAAAEGRRLRRPQAGPREGEGGEFRVREQERRLIEGALARYPKISMAAEALGISRSTLYRRIEELNIERGDIGGKRRRKPEADA